MAIRHIKGTVGVAISTTGQAHRMGFLDQCVRAWRAVLPEDSTLVVTVDGSPGEVREAVRILGSDVAVLRVGQPSYENKNPRREGRAGVAANKNTGLEFLMSLGVDHLFLCDDDTWPLYTHSLTKHTDSAHYLPHSIVSWGASRLLPMGRGQQWAEWSWPRGVLLYATKEVVHIVGGMDEAFGPGGHEHAEWSRRIHQHGFTPGEYVSPASYAENGVAGRATRASSLWYCADMRAVGESLGQLGLRRRRITTLARTKEDNLRIATVMAARDGNTAFVPYTAQYNRRLSATLCSSLPRQGAEGDNQA